MNREKQWKQIIDDAANAGFVKYCYGGVALLDINCNVASNKVSIPAQDVIQILQNKVCARFGHEVKFHENPDCCCTVDGCGCNTLCEWVTYDEMRKMRKPIPGAKPFK